MIYLILLAAGYSRRFHGDKLFYPIYGRPMYAHITGRLLAIAQADPEHIKLLVVARDPRLIEQLQGQPLQVVVNRESREGIASSIRAGLNAVEGLCPDSVVVFFVADQPFLRTETIVRFLSGYLESGKKLGCVGVGSTMGNPAAFSGSYIQELRTLKGDRGGKQILNRRRQEVFLYQAQDKLELMDIDTRNQIYSEMEETYMKKEIIFTEQAPKAVGPYVQATKVNGMIYSSGQLGLDPQTGKLPEGVDAQAHNSMKNLGAVLKAAGSDYGKIVKTTIFLTNMDDFAAVNSIYEFYFDGNYPARSCVQVAKLPLGGLVEIECIAME